MTNTRQVTPEELAVQRGYMDRVREHYERRLSHRSPLACVRTFGCQQNVSDSEHIKGMLADRKSTRLNSSHRLESRMPSSA